MRLLNRYAISSRGVAVWHWLRGHRILWRTNQDHVCTGDIVCETCDLLIWCRAHD